MKIPEEFTREFWKISTDEIKVLLFIIFGAILVMIFG